MQNGSLDGLSEHHDAEDAEPSDNDPQSKSVHDEPLADDHNEGPPTKRRKLADAAWSQTQSPRKSSPPWKKVIVEGPTSFVENGKRKSSRFNAVPLELQPQSETRKTRAAHKSSLPTTKNVSKVGTQRGNAPVTGQSAVNEQRPTSAGNGALAVAKSRSTKDSFGESVKASSSKTVHSNISTPTKSRRQHKAQVMAPSSPNEPPVKIPARRGRPPKRPPSSSAASSSNSSASDSSVDEASGGGLPADYVNSSPTGHVRRIKFKTVKLAPVPVTQPHHIAPPKKYSSFRDFYEKDKIHPFAGEYLLSPREAAEEARLRLRIWKAREPGGVLSERNSELYREEPNALGLKQYTHYDHVAAHAIYFKTLLDKEKVKHRSSAKKLAQEALQEWRRRHTSPQDLLAELIEHNKVKFRRVIKDLVKMWAQVTSEVVKDRQRVWEEQQLAIVAEQHQKVQSQRIKAAKAAVERRRRGASIDPEGDDDDSVSPSSEAEDDVSDDSSTADEDNMSSNDSESQDDSLPEEDEDLTSAELSAKYEKALEELRIQDKPVGAPNNQSHVHITEVDSATVVGVEQDAPDMVSEAAKPQSSVHGAAPSSKQRPGVPASISNGKLGHDSHAAEADRDLHDAHEIRLMENVDRSSNPHANRLSRRRSGGDLLSLENLDDSVIDDDNESIDTNDGEDDEEDLVEEGISDDDDDDEEEEEDSQDEDPKLGLASLLLGRKQLNAIKADESQNVAHPAVHSDARTGFIQATEAQDAERSPKLRNLDNHTATNILPEHSDEAAAALQHDSVEYSSQASPRSFDSSPMEVDSVSSADARTDSANRVTPATPKPTAMLKTQVPSLLRGTLREYQHYGLDWLAGLYENHDNGILADEMGLGKTIQTIALLAHLALKHEVWGPHLIVVPTSVILNWEMEFKKFCPGFKVLTYYGTQEERKQKRKGWRDENSWHVCITSYTLVLQDQNVLKRKRWHYMILDEAHNIKNFKSERWQTLLDFNTRARLLLSGTPLQNNLLELWALFYFVERDVEDVKGFSGLQEFISVYAKVGNRVIDQGRNALTVDERKTITELQEILRPRLLRRLKADVEKQMPAKYEHVVNCRLSKTQRQLYDGFMSRADTRETLASGNHFSIVNCLMQLRKVCNHPDLFETRAVRTSLAMPKSAVADYEVKELLVRRKLLRESPLETVDLDFLNLAPISREEKSLIEAIESTRLMAYRNLAILRGRQYERANPANPAVHNGSSIEGVLASMESVGRRSRLAELERTMYYESIRHRQRPIYGQKLFRRLSMGVGNPAVPQPIFHRRELSEWFSNQSSVLGGLCLSVQERASRMESEVQKFACLTPAVVAPDLLEATLSVQGISRIRQEPNLLSADPFHEARTCLTIAFPDKRLLQYDCGKLQQLDKLLRQLQAGGHRVLIFTQMTKVLDILEQFLNLHGHRYLRLDGATKPEQRQASTERFNNDPRILAFILSSRSGGVGINLTGADTVVFYDMDWNPAMDKQCQDRCHRIGQTRDVHIYRFVSEHTIETNILRKANQKRMLDDVIIQEGNFTTEAFNKAEDGALGDGLEDGDAMASAAIDRVLGAAVRGEEVFEQAEDKEDVVAATSAKKEWDQQDADDFKDEAVVEVADPTPISRAAQPPAGPAANEAGSTHAPTPKAGASSARATPFEPGGTEGEVEMHIDQYLLSYQRWELKDIAIGGPVAKSKKKSKKGQEHRIKRAR